MVAPPAPSHPLACVLVLAAVSTACEASDSSSTETASTVATESAATGETSVATDGTAADETDDASGCTCWGPIDVVLDPGESCASPQEALVGCDLEPTSCGPVIDPDSSDGGDVVGPLECLLGQLAQGQRPSFTITGDTVTSTVVFVDDQIHARFSCGSDQRVSSGSTETDAYFAGCLDEQAGDAQGLFSCLLGGVPSMIPSPFPACTP